MGFFSVPRLPSWSFQQRIHGRVLPPPHCPDKSGPAGSPTDTLRKDSTLPPVTSKQSIGFLRMVKIAGFFKGLMLTKFLFETPLSIQGPWLIKDIRFYSKRKRLDIYVDF
jgi:hypothetical protein